MPLPKCGVLWPTSRADKGTDPLPLTVRISSAGPRPVPWCGCRRRRPSCHGPTVAAQTRGGGEVSMRPYEIMVILDPTLDERTVAPSLETFLNVVRKDGGTVDKVDIWGKRRLAYEIAKHAEGIYVVVDLKAEPATVSELDRQLSLNESVLRTKVMRTDKH